MSALAGWEPMLTPGGWGYSRRAAGGRNLIIIPAEPGYYFWYMHRGDIYEAGASARGAERAAITAARVAAALMAGEAVEYDDEF